jgi:hypothetical protein
MAVKKNKIPKSNGVIPTVLLDNNVNSSVLIQEGLMLNEEKERLQKELSKIDKRIEQMESKENLNRFLFSLRHKYCRQGSAYFYVHDIIDDGINEIFKIIYEEIFEFDTFSYTKYQGRLEIVFNIKLEAIEKIKQDEYYEAKEKFIKEIETNYILCG